MLGDKKIIKCLEISLINPRNGGTSFVDLLCIFCLVFAMHLCSSGFMCFVVTCWERADLLALVCGVNCVFVTFPLISLVQVWYLIVSITYRCTLSYFMYY